jgi:hypothetical protein
MKIETKKRDNGGGKEEPKKKKKSHPPSFAHCFFGPVDVPLLCSYVNKVENFRVQLLPH